MRTVILVTATAFLLAMGFLVYWWNQPTPSIVQKKAQEAPALRRADRATDKPVGPGKGVWYTKFDEDTAKIASRFKADDYAPRNDGWVVVSKPRAQFFMKDNKALVIEGDSGEIIMEDKANKTGMKALSGQAETPSRGRLFNVRVQLFHEVDDPVKLDDPGKAAALTITLNNCSFDNQTFKIYSEQYKDGKTLVPHDRVPVTLIGDEYDFHGYGLVIRWNERDQRLQHLEIAHGKELIVKNPDSLLGDQKQQAGRPLPAMLAAKNKSAAAELVADEDPDVPAPRPRRNRAPIEKPKITPNTDPPLYRAVFHENVKVAQGLDLNIIASKLSIDFLMEDQEETPTTRPSTTQPTTRRARRAKARRQAENAQRLVVNWTGKLVVEPLSVGPETPLAAGQAVIRFEGAPVVATQQGSTITCGTLAYRTEDQTMQLGPMGDKPVVMKDAKGAVVQTVRMDFSNVKKQAVLHGKSSALFPQEDAGGKSAAPLLANWSKTCTLHFASSTTKPAEPKLAPSEMNIERAELDGDVNIDHPQLKLKSNALELAFDTSSKATTQPFDDNARKRAALAEKLKLAEARFAGTQLELREVSNLVTDDWEKRYGEKMALVEKVEKRIWQLETDYQSALSHGMKPKYPDEIAELRQAAMKLKGDMQTTSRAALRVQDLNRINADLEKEKADINTRLKTLPASATTRAAATRPAVRTDLKQIVATGAVHAQIIDSNKKAQTIDCNRLTLQTTQSADGKLYPSTFNADGDVHAVDEEQDLRAGHLAVVLRPSTRPTTNPTKDSANTELQSLIAHKDVRVTGKDGTVAIADQLLVDNKEGKNTIKLLGQPFATISDAKNKLTGPIIQIYPDAQHLEVIGAGAMKGVQQEKPTDPEQPINVAWQRSLSFDGKANTIDVTGAVSADMKDLEGAINNAKGERVKMLLADAAPTTRPTTQPATKPAKDKSPYAGIGAKTVKQITFSDSAQVSSTLLAGDGSLLRRVHLEAATIDYDMVTKKMTIPVEGRMIVEDHRPTTQPAKTAVADVSESGAIDTANSRGTTAFQWTRKFTYDDATRQAVMEGDFAKPVVIVHKDDSEKGQAFRLTGDTVTAELEEVLPATDKATTKPAQKKVQLKRVTALGHLVFSGAGAEIKAVYMEYDPKTDWLIARGTDREPVDFTALQNRQSVQQAMEVQYNLRQDKLIMSKPTGRGSR